jgi:hypothetical protein
VLAMIQSPYELDGRVTTFPTSARGFATSNCYLVIEGRHALLLDTGWTVDEAAVLSAIERAGGDDLTLSVFPLRLGEYDSICNVRPIVERFSVDRLYGGQRNGVPWVDFRPEWTAPGERVGSPRLDEVQYTHIRERATIAVDPEARREVEVLRPKLRLLTTHWVYDPGTRTLFTSDAFAYLARDHADGPWVSAGEPLPTVDEVAHHLGSTRYWWLRSADTRRLIDDLDATFARLDVERIAPAHGCVIDGADAVAAHVEILRNAIERLGERPIRALAA